MAIITLMTDYGTQDHFVAVVKGVILGIAKNADLVDVTHEIPAHNILHAAFILRQVWSWFPSGTIHLAIVDPGVGSTRRLLVGQYDGRMLVAPDNGLVTFVHRDFPMQALHFIENPRLGLPVVSNTFHGRDVLAPAAAHLANGAKLFDFGRAADRVELLSVPHKANSTPQGIRGRVLHVDRFGNLITNIRMEQLAAPRVHNRAWEVLVGGVSIGPIRASFHEVAVGEPVAYMGSSGHLEVALNQGRASDRFGKPQDIIIEVS